MPEHRVKRYECGCLAIVGSDGEPYLNVCRLHLAAPDLLAACKRLLEWSCRPTHSHEVEKNEAITFAQKAIARAEK